MKLSRQVSLLTCGAVAGAVVLSGGLGLALVQHAYDAQAQDVLHREAVLLSRVVVPGRARPVDRVLAGAGVRVVRVQPDGRVLGRLHPDPADVAAAAAGQPVSGVRDLPGGRYLVDVEPVGQDGGIILLQPRRQARATSYAVLRRLALALLVGLVVAGALGALLARRVARPLGNAARAAHRMAAGERDVRLAPDGPDEVAEVAAGLNGLAGALAVSEARQREFLLSVSHELRTPLTAVTGFAEALADGIAVDPAAAGRTIAVEAARLDRLVSDLLELARIGAQEFRLDIDDVDLVPLVQAAAGVWSARCAAVQVPFTLELGPARACVRSDAGRLRQVLDGLLENALCVTGSGVPVLLALQEEPGCFALEVRDGGPGLSEQDLPVAFSRGVLHDRYRGVRPGGTGVGLALVEGLVRRLGGTAVAGQAPEGGAAFTVRLPR